MLEAVSTAAIAYLDGWKTDRIFHKFLTIFCSNIGELAYSFMAM